MARKLRIAVSVFFAVLAAICILWVRSYWQMDWLEAQRSGRYAAITSVNGAIRVDSESSSESLQIFRLCSIRFHDRTVQGFPNHTLKFAWHTDVALVVVPHWFLATIAATISAVAAIGWKGRFSLRTLLIATTLVALVLGLGVWAAS